MTIAREQAIARCVESQAARRNAASVSVETAHAAITRAEERLGHPMTAGQRQAVEGILTSGRGVELVVGVAGAGKTTALAATRDAFEAAGYELVGTSTSGQAARTLGREAGIETSRALASVNWRIQHNSLRLTPRHVAVLDEAAMADDASLVAFLESARTTGAKVVAVGDPRQLGSVGPGGGFEALVSRFGGAVHVLTENVRQVDRLERSALNHLRSGDVEAAVAWYSSNGRIAVSPDRDTALDATVSGWAADVCNGGQAAMYAWKRANVAELNRRGREAWEEMGRLTGPELVVGDTSYRAGDRIVALAPGAHGEVVTSECGTVDAVDVIRRELGATMDDDGRFQRFGPEEIDASHLAHGYAVTVHRAQGATVGRAHAFEDGGGRELAYVKMSRARACSTVYVVADSVEQATEDLCRSWSRSQRIGWAIDRGTPAPGADVTHPAPLSPSMSASLRHARLVAEREALAAVIPADPRYALRDAERRVQHLEYALKGLDEGDGWGAWKGTPVGDAANAWQRALREWRSCSRQAEHAGWRERHGLLRRADRAAEQEGPLRQAFEHLAGPERECLEAELPEARKLYEELGDRYAGHAHYQVAHPEALRRLDLLDIQISGATWELDIEREGLDGIATRPAQLLQRSRGLERDIDMHDLGIELEL